MLKMKKISVTRTEQTNISSHGIFFLVIFAALFMATKSFSNHEPILWTFDAASHNIIEFETIDYLDDVDGDTVPEIGISYLFNWVFESQIYESPGFSLLSGATGVPIWDINDGDGVSAFENFESMGDVNGDSVSDIILKLRYDGSTTGSFYSVVLSGADGSVLYLKLTTGESSPVSGLLNNHDLNNDGVNDLVLRLYNHHIQAIDISISNSNFVQMVRPVKDKIVHEDQLFQWTNADHGILVIGTEPYPSGNANAYNIYLGFHQNTNMVEVHEIRQDVEKIYVTLITVDSTGQYVIQNFVYKTTYAD